MDKSILLVSVAALAMGCAMEASPDPSGSPFGGAGKADGLDELYSREFGEQIHCLQSRSGSVPVLELWIDEKEEGFVPGGSYGGEIRYTAGIFALEEPCTISADGSEIYCHGEVEPSFFLGPLRPTTKSGSPSSTLSTSTASRIGRLRSMGGFTSMALSTF